MDVKIERLVEFIRETQSAIFKQKLALVSESYLRVLQMEATRLGLSAEDLNEMQTVLDTWANQCVLQAKQRLTEAFLPFIQELVL